MSYGYSIDLRERVLSYIEDGHTQKEASEVFKIPRQTIYNWLCLKTDLSKIWWTDFVRRSCFQTDLG